MVADLMVKTQVATHATTQLSIETKFSLVMELAHKISSSLDLDVVLQKIVADRHAGLRFEVCTLWACVRVRQHLDAAHTSSRM